MEGNSKLRQQFLSFKSETYFPKFKYFLSFYCDGFPQEIQKCFNKKNNNFTPGKLMFVFIYGFTLLVAISVFTDFWSIEVKTILF